MRTVLILLTLLAIVACSNQERSEPEEDVQESEQVEDAVSNKLPGLAPADIYLSMEDRGFKTDKQIGGELGNSWTCKSAAGGIEYTVDIFSTGSSDVESVRATAMISSMEPQKALPFIQFVASAPIEGVDREAVLGWITANFDKDKVNYESGEVRYWLYAPSQMVRMLRIEHKSVGG